jgi:hypothetical protein
MLVDVARGALLTVAAYLVIGLLVAVPYLTFGIGRTDASARTAPWTFRVIVLPGVVVLWPWVLRLWIRPGRPH